MAALANAKALMRGKLLSKGIKKIEHPLCRYNGTQMICVLCDAPVKNEFVWAAHILGKPHKEV